MLIILSFYAGIIWLVFFRFKLLAWNRTAQIFVGIVGLCIALLVIGLLNTRTPSGRATVMGRVVEVRPTVAGTVTEIPVAPNTPIERGDVLFRIDDRPYQYAVDDAAAQLKLAQLSLDRKQAVQARGGDSISQQSIDESQAGLDQAKARLAQAQYELDNTVVKAAGPGIVTSMRLSVGDQARPLNGVMPIIQTDSLMLLAVFAQNGTAALIEGTEAKIAFNALPGQIFDTHVESLVPGTAGGQVGIGTGLVGSQDLGNASEALVKLAWPSDLPVDQARLGMIGTVTVFGAHAGPLEPLAKILLWVRVVGTYL